MIAIPVVADAETLFRGTTRALLIHLDYRGLIRLHWSPLLLGEMSDALVRTGRKASVDAALHHEQLMISALPNAMIDTQDVQQQFRMVQHAVKSTKDMHVAACALALRAANAYGVNLEVDPSGTPGTLAYFKGVRSIRLQLLPLGWRLSRAGNVESTVNDELGIQICFQNVDVACQEREPQATSGKGAGCRKLIHDGQVDLFDRVHPAAVDAIGVTPTVWVVCVSSDAKKLRTEVSCPEAFEGNQFEGFSKRIFVVDENLEPAPQGIDQPDEDGGAGDYEVRIARR